jgi:hypothetical protein
MSISTIISSIKEKISSMIGGVDVSSLHDMFEVFGYECALCESVRTDNDFIGCDETLIPVCVKCKKRNREGSSWSSILKSNFPRKTVKYSKKYLTIILWLSEED